MPDIRTSIHGKRLGLTADDSLALDGQDIYLNNSGSTKPPRISGRVSTAPSTAAGLDSVGVHALTSSPVGYTLADPVPGQRVTIAALNPTTATGRFVQTSTANGVTMGSSGGFNKWSSTAAQSLELIGLTTTLFGVISNNLASSLSTTPGAFSTI